MYYAKVFKKDLGRGLEILSDILMNSLIDASAVHRERDVILREMEEVNKQQEEVRVPCGCGCGCGAFGQGRSVAFGSDRKKEGRSREGEAETPVRQAGTQAHQQRNVAVCLNTRLYHTPVAGSTMCYIQC